MTHFSDSKAIADYAERATRLVPGLRDMQRMTELLLAEGTPQNGRVLVIGAGGGMELKLFAQTHPDWRFVGVDPSAEMLSLAKNTLGPLASQVELHEGYVDSAPLGPFDSASCLLTLHFIEEKARLKTLQEIHRRLNPGGPLVLTHLSFPQDGTQRGLWLSRYTAFAISSGVDPEMAKSAAKAIGEQLPILTPEQDEALIRKAGFSDVRLFYVGLTFRGWVAYA